MNIDNNIITIIEIMDKQTRQEIEKRTNERIEKSPKYWNNTYIKHQIDKRNNGETFNINDHIRAMVYSMLSKHS